MRYEICVEGHLGVAWSRWFDPLTIEELADGSTSLRGELPDQAALYGVLNKVRDLGMTLLSVRQISPAEQSSSACVD